MSWYGVNPNCLACKGTGYEAITANFKEVWGRTIVNGQLICELCNARARMPTLKEAPSTRTYEG